MRVREPVARPLDVVAVELLLTAAQAFLVGVLLYVAVGLWEDRGVGSGSVTAVPGLLGLAVGGAWAYWLLGGMGWPMAAANAASVIFLGGAFVLSWTNEAFHIGGAPTLLALMAALLGVGGGVFLDSPRRWRWDQRERLRPGTRVPRVSPVTRTLVGRIPRSIPRRARRPEPVSELAARLGAPAAAGRERAPELGHRSTPRSGDERPPAPPPPESGPEPRLTDAPAVAGTPLEVQRAPEPVLPPARPGRTGGNGKGTAGTGESERAGEREIELPTMVEPGAQRSPWAWAAPPTWTREEEDEPARSDSSRKA